jgi:putative NADH-flavin reductase
MTTVAVFGASGRTGSEALLQARGRGCETIGVYRQRPDPTIVPRGVRVRVVDLASPASVCAVMEAAEAVVVAFGQRPRDGTAFCAAATATIVRAMETLGIRRLICITGAMVGSDPTRDAATRWLVEQFRRRRPEVAADREEQERVVEQSRLDWTLVKPPRLTGGPATGRWRAGPCLRAGLFASISRGDLVAFVLREMDTSEHRRAGVVVIGGSAPRVPRAHRLGEQAGSQLGARRSLRNVARARLEDQR